MNNSPNKKEWVGVDLDGTLAKYNGWHGADQIGEPIEPMVNRIQQWLARGIEVRIITARVCSNRPASEIFQARSAIQKWCECHIGVSLLVTSEKDFSMAELWDDRAVQVIYNTGLRADGKD